MMYTPTDQDIDEELRQLNEIPDGDEGVEHPDTQFSDWGGSRQGAGRPPVNFRIEFEMPEIARWFYSLSNEERARIVASAYGRANLT